MDGQPRFDLKEHEESAIPTRSGPAVYHRGRGYGLIRVLVQSNYDSLSQGTAEVVPSSRTCDGTPQIWNRNHTLAFSNLLRVRTTHQENMTDKAAVAEHQRAQRSNNSTVPGSLVAAHQTTTFGTMANLPGNPVWQRDSSHAHELDYHLSMLLDTARMDSYRRAIDASVQPGDVVVDIGCGTGVLSFMACEAGAERVYAIEGGPVIDVARELAIDNGFADRIEFLGGWSVDIDIPEPVDVLITETIGHAGLDEGIIAWISDARKRFLRAGAVMLPQRLRLWVAAAESFDDHALISDWWAPDLPYDYTAAHRRAAQTLWFADIMPSSLLGQPELAADIDLTTAPNETTTSAGHLRVDRDGILHGLACWFDSLLCAGVTVDNSPPRTNSSWSQGFMPLAEPLAVSAGDQLSWELSISADGQHWTWQVDHAGG